MNSGQAKDVVFTPAFQLQCYRAGMILTAFDLGTQACSQLPRVNVSHPLRGGISPSPLPFRKHLREAGFSGLFAPSDSRHKVRKDHEGHEGFPALRRSGRRAPSCATNVSLVSSLLSCPCVVAPGWIGRPAGGRGIRLGILGTGAIGHATSGRVRYSRRCQRPSWSRIARATAATSSADNVPILRCKRCLPAVVIWSAIALRRAPFRLTWASAG